jgi:isoleucyl-tRNA synthetase
MDWDHTLNLPKTSFPMKAELVKREPQFQRFWQEQDIYHKALEKPAPRGLFILHDGPPYSNGDIHMGHALNKTLKDIIVKFRMLQGYRSPFVPGWDNHGMPIENEVTKEFRRKGEKPDKVTLRKRCREYAAHFVNRQREQFQRLGCIGDWENPYLTMSYEFEATLVRVFGELVERGYIYRGLKPVLWCPVCETALADAEIEYHTHTSPSITVRFALKEDPGGVFPVEDGKQAYILIWTTTPWTIPSNLAVAVHPAEPYAIVETDGAQYLLAEALVESTMSRIGAKEYRVVRTVPGNQLSGLVFQHPLYGRESPVVFADYVTMTEGTRRGAYRARARRGGLPHRSGVRLAGAVSGGRAGQVHRRGGRAHRGQTCARRRRGDYRMAAGTGRADGARALRTPVSLLLALSLPPVVPSDGAVVHEHRPQQPPPAVS